MLKKLLLAGLLVAASASAWAQSGQLGANQIWGNPTGSGAPSKPSNIGSFLTQGTGITISGTPKATIGITNTITAAGPSGSATQTPVITYNAQGQLTVVTLATIAPPFSAITGSLACSQEPAHTGDTTSPAGSCVNTTVKVNGIAFGATAAVDTVPVITAANTTATYTALPNCMTGALQYATSTHLFTCAVGAGSGTVTSVTGGNGISVATGTSTPVITNTGVVSVTVQKFSSTGTYTPHAGMIFAQVECVGAGASGGGTGPGTAGNVLGASGGGSGGYSRVLLSAATVGASKAIVIGTGGAAPTAGNNNGNSGSAATTFGSTLCVANVGGGGSGTGGGVAVVGGPGATVGTGDVAFAGFSGGAGAYSNAATVILKSGYGGNSVWAGGGRETMSATSSSGEAGQGCGAGGSGGTSFGVVANTAGGAGSNGCVVVTEFNNQ